MQFKTIFSLLVILLSAVFTNAKVCSTQEGVAWCNALGSKCYYKAGGTFNRSYCSSSSSIGNYNFNGANCRKCPSTYCDIVTPNFYGTVPAYHSYNGYRLTKKGWCYWGN